MDWVVMRRDLSFVLSGIKWYVWHDFHAAQQSAIVFGGVVLPIDEAKRIMGDEKKSKE